MSKTTVQRLYGEIWAEDGPLATELREGHEEPIGAAWTEALLQLEIERVLVDGKQLAVQLLDGCLRRHRPSPGAR